MTEYLLHPERLGADEATADFRYYRDADLAAEILEHFEAAFPGEPPIAAARRQFGARVFIQPAYGIELESNTSFQPNPILKDCTQGAPMQRAAQLRGQPCPLSPAAYDEEFLAKPRGWVETMLRAGIDTMMTPSGFERRFGVHPSQVVGLTGPQRAGAFRFGTGSHFPTAEPMSEAWQQEFGALEPWDGYFIEVAPNRFEFDHIVDLRRSLSLFLEQAPWIKTLITDATFDVWRPSTAVLDSIEALSADQGLDVIARYRGDPGDSEERPGWLELEYGPRWAQVPSDRRHVRVRMPRYELSAHVVTMTEGPLLMRDVRRFLLPDP